MSENNQETRNKLLQLVSETIAEEKALREKYQIGDKFRFIRDKLALLQAKVDEGLQEIDAAKPLGPSALAADEALVFVYLFNAQGLVASTWQKMLHSSVYYEYSVNRPIYMSKDHIESFIRSKPNKVQHGYLTVAIKKDLILPALADSPALKDINGNELIKIKEGSLHFNRVIAFRYNDADFTVLESGEMLKKE